MIPRVGTAADVYAIDIMVTKIKTEKGLKNALVLGILSRPLWACKTSLKSPAPHHAMKAYISGWRTMPPQPARAQQ